MKEPKLKSGGKIISADKFRDKKTGLYMFPFQLMDKDYGRIEWCVEPIFGKKDRKMGRCYIEGILVWAKQTKDKRYAGKTFLIPCYTEALTNSSVDKGDGFLNNAWYFYMCPEHRRVAMWAYPKDGHKMLTIDASSSVSMEIRFK